MTVITASILAPSCVKPLSKRQSMFRPARHQHGSRLTTPIVRADEKDEKKMDMSLDDFVNLTDAAEKSADGPLGLGSSLPDGLKFSREQVTAIITGAISLFLAFAYLFLARTLDSREMTPAVMDEDLPQMQSRL